MSGRPAASSPDALERMQAQRRKDTRAERAIRSALHRRGFRYRLEWPVPGRRRRIDIAFPSIALAVFVDGCFWHGCPEHATWPKANAEWWREKIEANRVRDADTNARLEAAGWRVIRVWEHEDPDEVAALIAAEVSQRRDAISARPGLSCVKASHGTGHGPT